MSNNSLDKNYKNVVSPVLFRIIYFSYYHVNTDKTTRKRKE